MTTHNGATGKATPRPCDCGETPHSYQCATTNKTEGAMCDFCFTVMQAPLQSVEFEDGKICCLECQLKLAAPPHVVAGKLWKHEPWQREHGWIVKGPGGNFGPFKTFEEAHQYAADLNSSFNSLTNDLIGLKNARHDDAQKLSELHNSHDALRAEVSKLKEILGRVLIHSTQETSGVHLVNALKDAAEAIGGVR